MQTIFIGSVYPKEREEEIKHNSKVGIDNAANNLQWALLSGLDYYYPNLIVITYPNIGTYPLKYEKIHLKKSNFSHKPGSHDFCLGFINIPLLKHVVKAYNLFRVLKNVLNTNEQTTIFIYGVHSPFLKAVFDLKKNYQKIKICQIVPDLPQFMSESRNPIYLFLKKIDSILIKKYLKEVSSFVLLSNYMADALQIGDKPWARVEGIFFSPQDINNVSTKEINKTILYTGNIDERYNIKTLIKAFRIIDDANYRLWIRGNGNTKQYLIEEAKNDSRIKYFEEMTRKELLNLQKQATVLINPVSSSENFTKYFFPSKIIDYLASGTPSIMNRLDGIPDEYYNYCFVPKNDSAEGLKEAIIEVCEKDQSELDEFGRKASQFILEYKNPIVQVKKIFDLINK